MTLDEAIELLEITEDIDNLTEKDLNNKRRRAMGRWHPDSVATANTQDRARYETNFKNIDLAVKIILKYKSGAYYPGQDFDESSMNADNGNRSQETMMRSNASKWKSEIQNVWQQIKNNNWEINTRETILSDGYSLRDKLRQDIKDDVTAIATNSLFLGFYAFVAFGVIGIFIPFLIFLLIPVFSIHCILCILLILPLSRIWLPNWLLDAAIYSCNFGLKIGDFIMKTFGRWSLFRALVNWPFYFAKGVALLFIRPLYELAGYLLREKKVGVKKRKERYFGDYPELYVEELLKKDSNEMTWFELRHLSDVYHKSVQFNF